MPTIEIVSLGATNLSLNQSEYELGIREEKQLKSHRGIFYDWLIDQKGVIVHLGNPEFKEDKQNGFYAGELIDWEFEELPPNPHKPSRFKFLAVFWKEIFQIIENAIGASPNKKAYFLTDIQFEMEGGERIETSLADFDSLYHSKGLRWNTLYCLQ